ncbi:hypothetical protein ACXIZN_16155 [Amycolatopsis sp. TRM77291]
MCGIVAIHGEPVPLLGRHMLDRIAHRGPDDHGSVELPNTGWATDDYPLWTLTVDTSRSSITGAIT